MNRLMNRLMTGTLMALALMVAPLSLSAQMEESERGKGGMEGMMGGGMGMMGAHGMDVGMMGMMKMMKAVSHLDLTPDQRKKIELQKLQHQKEAIPLLGRIRMAGVELRELLLADSVDMEKAKMKVKEKHDAMAELEVGHLALMRQVKGVLTPEQRQKMESMVMEGPSEGMGKDKKGHKEGAGRPDGPHRD